MADTIPVLVNTPISSVSGAANFTSADIEKILVKFSNIRSFINQFLDQGISIPGLDDLLVNAESALPNFNSVTPRLVDRSNTTTAIVFDLPSSQLSFIVSNDILIQIANGTTSYLLAVDYAIDTGFLQDAFEDTPLDGLLPSQAEIVVSTQPVISTLGEELNSGVSLIAKFNIADSDNPLLRFQHKALGIDSITGIINIADSHQSVTGKVELDKQLFNVLGFSVTAKEFSFSVGAQGAVNPTPVFTAEQTIAYQGYDPTQADEPTLLISNGFKVDPTSLSIFAQVGTGQLGGWNNPFGFTGAEIRTLAMQVGATYLPVPTVDNVGVVADLAWGIYNLKLATMIDINTPTNSAFSLTVYDKINLVELFAKMNSNLLGEHGSKLVALAHPLFKYIPVTIISLDSDNDGVLDPLMSVVPVETKIATTTIEAGMSVNAKVDLFGKTGKLALNASSDFLKLDGMLEIEHFKLGDFISISGGQAGTNLMLAFHVDATKGEAYFKGDGLIDVLGLSLSAHFDISPDNVHIENSYLDLAVAQFNIDHLDLNLQHGTGSGLANMTVLGKVISAVSFNATEDRVNFDANLNLGLASIDGSFDLNQTTQEIIGNGDVKILGKTIAESSFKAIPGFAEIGGKLDLAIASIDGLFVWNQSNGSISGTGDVFILDKKIAAAGLTVTSNLVQFTGKLDLGDLTMDTTFTWNKTLGEISATGTVLVNGNTLAGASFKLDADGDLSITGNLGVDVPGLGNIGTSITIKYEDNVLMVKATGDLGIVGEATVRMEARLFSPDKIIAMFGDVITDAVGTVSGYTKALIDGGENLLNAAKNFFTSDQVEDLGKQILGDIGGFIGINTDDRITYVGTDNANDKDGASKRDTLFGNGGNDRLNGKDANDFIDGGAGDDTLIGGAQEDIIFGGLGNDRMNGETGHDKLYGGLGNDTIFGETGDDIIEGGAGDDEIYGGSDDDSIDGGAGDDIIYGGMGYNTLRGGSGNDTIYLSEEGGEANILAYGGDGNDTLIGYGGDDTINGEEGDDSLDGGTGRNSLTGGNGNDTYIVRTITDNIIESSNQGVDTVRSEISYTL
ncbi:calcium-binding protein, partial [Undibacterium sp.]|uniref:calcium-binding protein n=1 Tax=Undibacterium sp. TaxID=1914977 RepID=UPI0037532095